MLLFPSHLRPLIQNFVVNCPYCLEYKPARKSVQPARFQKRPPTAGQNRKPQTLNRQSPNPNPGKTTVPDPFKALSPNPASTPACLRGSLGCIQGPSLPPESLYPRPWSVSTSSTSGWGLCFLVLSGRGCEF